MKKVLCKVLLGLLLGGASLGVWAQCASGGAVGTGGFCYYSDASCPTHQPYNIPAYCNKTPTPSPPPKPDKWGAVAWNNSNGLFDTSVGEPTAEEAKRVALQKCGTDCEIKTVYANQCVSVFLGLQPDGRGFRTSELDPISSRAEQKASTLCNTNANNCQLVFTECSL